MPKYDYPGYRPTPHGLLEPRPGSVGGFHGGVDTAAAPGTPVYAEHAGTVFRSGLINGYGMAVVVKSITPNGTKFYELYGHLGPDALPDPETPIIAGKPIPGARVGTEEFVKQFANSNFRGPHLHREIISGDAPLKRDGKFGIYSSNLTFKADPDTFDINHPIFPYLPGGATPPSGKRGPNTLPDARSMPVGQFGPSPQSSSSPGLGPGPQNDNAPQAGPGSAQRSPGTAIPGAEWPSSIGGPSGPTPLVPPASPLPPPTVGPRRRSGNSLQQSPNDTQNLYGNPSPPYYGEPPQTLHGFPYTLPTPQFPGAVNAPPGNAGFDASFANTGSSGPPTATLSYDTGPAGVSSPGGVWATAQRYMNGQFRNVQSTGEPDDAVPGQSPENGGQPIGYLNRADQTGTFNPAASGGPLPRSRPQAPAASWPGAPIAPLLHLPQAAPAAPAYPDWHDAADWPQQGLPNWAQMQPSTENAFPAPRGGIPGLAGAEPMAAQRPAPQPTLPVQNLTTRVLRMKGVPDADIAAAIGNPGKMQELLNQYYGRRSMNADDSGAFYNRIRQGSAANRPDQAPAPEPARPENYPPFGWAGLPALLP